jgi:hypothetical protein
LEIPESVVDLRQPTSRAAAPGIECIPIFGEPSLMRAEENLDRSNEPIAYGADLTFDAIA